MNTNKALIVLPAGTQSTKKAVSLAETLAQQNKEWLAFQASLQALGEMEGARLGGEIEEDGVIVGYQHGTR